MPNGEARGSRYGCLVSRSRFGISPSSLEDSIVHFVARGLDGTVCIFPSGLVV